MVDKLLYSKELQPPVLLIDSYLFVVLLMKCKIYIVGDIAGWFAKILGFLLINLYVLLMIRSNYIINV